MLNAIIRFSVRNKLIIGLFTLAWIIWGTIELIKLPVDALPDITSNQVQIITNTFAPSTNQIEQAQRVITAYRSAGGNAVQIDGQMIDEPVYQQALATLAKLPT